MDGDERDKIPRNDQEREAVRVTLPLFSAASDAGKTGTDVP
jgi:hypothetical protein